MPGDKGRRNGGRAAPGDDQGPGRQATARNQHRKSPQDTPGGTSLQATAELDVLQKDGNARLSVSMGHDFSAMETDHELELN